MPAEISFTEFFRSFLFVLAAMLAILNPLSTAPVLLSMTRGAPPDVRALLARRIARNMFFMMSVSMLVGSFVLDFFGISLPIVRIGGGLIVAVIGWRLLDARPDTGGDRIALTQQAFTREQAHRQGFYPLTFPVSCGPGSIATAITIGVSLHERTAAAALLHVSAGLTALAATAVLMYLAFRYAQELLRPLGEAGTDILLRLSAFIMLCVGVQIIWSGVRELILSLPAR